MLRALRVAVVHALPQGWACAAAALPPQFPSARFMDVCFAGLWLYPLQIR
jgi:hypothetical protein